MVNDELVSVDYGGKKLDVSGDLASWTAVKRFTFQPSSGSELRIAVKDVHFDRADPKHCEQYAGFILHCEAKDTSGQVAPQNPWHNFGSNINSWRSEGGTEVCNACDATSECDWHKSSAELNRLTSTGASIIWLRGQESAVLIGSPNQKY